MVSVVALLLASCGGGTEEITASGSTTPGGSASASATTASATASPTPEIRTDYDLPPYPELKKLFEYDTSEPLGYRVTGESDERGATVYAITYKSSGHAVPGSLVIPDGAGPFPVVLYAPALTVHTDFFAEDALRLAEDGYAGLLIENPSVYGFGCFFCWDARSDTKGWLQYATDARRAIDLLETLPEIDARRIGFVGHSIGGTLGGMLTGVETRIDAYVLMDGDGYLTQVQEKWRGHPEGQMLTRYQNRMAVLNPVNFIVHNRAATLLFQVSADADMPGVSSLALAEAAAEPKTLERFDSVAHEFGCSGYSNCDGGLPAFESHRAWLQENV